MRIAINGLHLIPGRLGGLETYLHELIRDLATVRRPDTEILFYCSRKYAAAVEAYRDSLRIVPVDVNVDSAVKRIFFEQYRLAQLLRRDRIEVLHSSGYTAPTMKVCRTVMTVHDLCYLEIPEMIREGQGSLRWLALRLLGPRSMKHSNRIITDTRHVASQIQQRCGIAPERIHSLHLKPVRNFSVAKEQLIELPAQFVAGYLLYVASWLPHKNHRTLLAAMAAAKSHGRVWPPLLLAGLHLVNDRQREDFDRTIAQFGLSDSVFACPDGLSVEQLAGLYRRAKIFVFPSLFEGFGYPMVEAMSAKLPVLCPALEPMLEVADGNAYTFMPHDSLDLFRKIEELLNDAALREHWSALGYQRYLNLCEATKNNGHAVMRIYEEVMQS